MEVNTLENAIYLGRKNDVSFVIDSRLNLYEHQSTFNPNMPVRDLFYVSKLYSKITDEMNLYSKRAVKIPFPQFITFYNGVEEQPERQVLKLSDLYPDVGKEFLREAYASNRMFSKLELDVLMININKGKNQELMEQCRLLYEYTVYVERVREYALLYDLETAVTMAVDHCIRDGILADFLRKCRAEVISMSIFEYNEEEHWRRIEQEEREFGREAGRLEGLEEGRREGLEAGRIEGRESGKAEGRAEGLVRALQALLSTKGELTEDCALCFGRRLTRMCLRNGFQSR
ncbi:MAG: hypothetical protein IJA58_03855 [Lachnospiraceae bacterium]|nr:hypothetical protein [Lachnospiraceae bacterium]